MFKTKLKANKKEKIKSKNKSREEKLSYNILRGKGVVGNLIEVRYGKIKILLDCGREIGNDDKALTDVEKKVLKTKYDAILISHYHLDHAALAGKARGKVYMGKTAKRL